MKRLIAKFDNTIRLTEFDEQIQKLVQNFPDHMSVLIKCRMNSKHVVAILEENPDQSSVERWAWDFNGLEDKIETLGETIN
jgi:hypothetical protein